MMKKLKFAHGRTLSSQEMKKFKGAEGNAQNAFADAGTGNCWITTYDENGAKLDKTYLPNSNSAGANDYCVRLIITRGTGVYRCTYTCDYSNGQ